MNTKIVAQLDTDFKFVSMTIVQESPEEPGLWLYPPNTVDLLPDPSINLEEYYAIHDSVTNAYSYVEKVSPVEKLRLLKLEKMNELIQVVDGIIGAYTYDYSQAEKLSWPKQETEALELLDDPNAEATFLRLLAIHRGSDVMTLRDKVLLNVENYVYLSSLIIGHQQKYADQIESFTVDDIEELKSLQFTFPI